MQLRLWYDFIDLVHLKKKVTLNTQGTLFGTNKGHIQNILAMCYHKDINYNLNVVGVASSSIDPASYIEKNASSDVLKQPNCSCSY